jgi:hypothetical protein
MCNFSNVIFSIANIRYRVAELAVSQGRFTGMVMLHLRIAQCKMPHVTVVSVNFNDEHLGTGDGLRCVEFWYSA